MSRLIESIRLMDGEFNNLTWHTDRMKRAWNEIFHISAPFSLLDELQQVTIPPKGIYKCRVVYDMEVRTIEFIPYQLRPVNSLRLIHDDGIEYSHKFENRDALERHFASRGHGDDVLIIKNGFVTDTTYANVVFRKGKEWFTPTTCLLQGTMRQSLIDQMIIQEEEIKLNEISRFKSIKLINSMLPWGEPELSTTFIHD